MAAPQAVNVCTGIVSNHQSRTVFGVATGLFKEETRELWASPASSFLPSSPPPPLLSGAGKGADAGQAKFALDTCRAAADVSDHVRHADESARWNRAAQLPHFVAETTGGGGGRDHRHYQRCLEGRGAALSNENAPERVASNARFFQRAGVSLRGHTLRVCHFSTQLGQSVCVELALSGGGRRRC